jgi:hypothetical protein
VETIYISVASYRDTQLKPTILSLLSTAKHPERLIFSVVSQNYDNEHPELETIVRKFNAKIFYQKIHPRLSNGAGHARSIAQRFLTTEYNYFLQIDSHARSLNNWDQHLIDEYITSSKKYDRFIHTVYPPAWEISYQHNEIFLGISESHGIIGPEFVDRADWITGFRPLPKPSLEKSLYGERSFWFCAGHAFGKAEYFLEVPYDPDMNVLLGTIAHGSGEEFTMSVRFYEKDINLVVPSGRYLWHLYESTEQTKFPRTDNVEGLSDSDNRQRAVNNEKDTIQRLHSFFSLSLPEKYGIRRLETIYKWFSDFEKDRVLRRKAYSFIFNNNIRKSNII